MEKSIAVLLTNYHSYSSPSPRSGPPGISSLVVVTTELTVNLVISISASIYSFFTIIPPYAFVTG